MNVRTGLSAVLLAVVAGSAMAEGDAKTIGELAPAVTAPADVCGAGCACPQPRCWIEGAYLNWSIKDAPLGFPLVTTGDPADPLAGAIGQPGTRVLYGGNGVDLGRSPGFRLTAGTWLDDHGPLGVEASAFWLDGWDATFRTASGAAGSPPIYLPSFNVTAGREGRLIVADPAAGFAGSVRVHSEARLWGAEANALFAVATGDTEVTLLAGLRYADLSESLTIENNSTDIAAVSTTTMTCRFATENHFYGGQVGARANTAVGRYTLGLTAKLALGQTRETIDVGGVTRVSAPAATLPGGFFALPTNTGHRTVSDFTAIPELNLRAGYQVTDGTRVFVGYDVLWWTQVARPGDQIDRNTNPTQSPVFGGGALIGPARPAFLTNTSSFHAQGLTAGVEFRY